MLCLLCLWEHGIFLSRQSYLRLSLHVENSSMPSYSDHTDSWVVMKWDQITSLFYFQSSEERWEWVRPCFETKTFGRILPVKSLMAVKWVMIPVHFLNVSFKQQIRRKGKQSCKLWGKGSSEENGKEGKGEGAIPKFVAFVVLCCTFIRANRMVWDFKLGVRCCSSDLTVNKLYYSGLVP